LAGPINGTLGALLAQPAVISVPLAFLAMIAASRTDPKRPHDVEAKMLALHAPEGPGLEALRAR